jgi:hypothetical protein
MNVRRNRNTLITTAMPLGNQGEALGSGSAEKLTALAFKLFTTRSDFTTPLKQ